MPVSADEGVGKVLVADGLNVLDVNDFAESAGVNDFFNGGIVGRVSEYYPAS